MWEAQYYCWCLTARHGTMIIGLLFLAGTLATTVWSGWDAANLIQGRFESKFSVSIKRHGDGEENDRPCSRGPGILPKSHSLDNVITYGAVILSVIDVVLTLMLLFGVATRSAAKCKPFLYYNAGLTLLFGIIMLYTSIFLVWVYGGWLGLYTFLATVIAMFVMRFVLGIVRDYCYEVDYAEFFNSPEWQKRRYDEEAYGYGDNGTTDGEKTEAQAMEKAQAEEIDAKATKV